MHDSIASTTTAPPRTPPLPIPPITSLQNNNRSRRPTHTVVQPPQPIRKTEDPPVDAAAALTSTAVDNPPYRINNCKFQNSLIRFLRSLHQTRAYTDVTLHAEGRFIQAHMIVLAAGSSYFNSLFKSLVRSTNVTDSQLLPAPPPQTIVVALPNNVKYKDLELVIKFIYCGYVDIVNSELESFVGLAKELGVVGMTVDEDEESENDDNGEKGEVVKLEKEEDCGDDIEEIARNVEDVCQDDDADSSGRKIGEMNGEIDEETGSYRRNSNNSRVFWGAGGDDVGEGQEMEKMLMGPECWGDRDDDDEEEEMEEDDRRISGDAVEEDESIIHQQVQQDPAQFYQQIVEISEGNGFVFDAGDGDDCDDDDDVEGGGGAVIDQQCRSSGGSSTSSSMMVGTSGGKPFVCTTCGKTYNSNKSLWRHKKFTCDVKIEFRCSVCGKVFSRSDNLRRHVVVAHHHQVG